MADVVQHVRLQVLDVLVPPVPVPVPPVVPVPDLELGQLGRQVHEGYGHDLGLPLQAQRGAEAVVDEGPRHLHHLLQLGLVALQALGVLDQGGVGVVNLGKN